MSVLGTVIVGIVILIGVIGAVVQIWPSAPVVGGAILVWSWMTGTRAAWIIFAIAAVVLILGTVLKYVIPARGMNKAGIPNPRSYGELSVASSDGSSACPSASSWA